MMGTMFRLLEIVAHTVRHNIREYSYAALMIATPGLVVAGVALLWNAISVEAHLAAFLILALAGCTFLGARELKPKEASADIQALPAYLERKEPH